MIRRAVPADADAICAIWNPIIRDTLITFNNVPKTSADLTQLIAERPVWVAQQDDQVAGFALYEQFRGGPGYAHTAEHSIFIADGARGTGIGRALMTQLMDHAKSHQIHSIVAALSATNADGMAFHEKMGFVQTARVPQAGCKFDQWIDLILMQKML